MHAADVDFSLLPEAIAEVQEHLPELERDLHRLVQSPDSGDLLASAFRHMHTIKGDFGYCRATPIIDFIHQLESVLQTMRDRSFQCSPLIAEALIQSMDQVQIMMETLAQTRQFDTKPRGALTGLIQQMAQARNQQDADQAARHILLAEQDVNLGEVGQGGEIAPLASTESVARALALGEQLASALVIRLPRWRGRAAQQCKLVLELNKQYLNPTNEDALKIAVYWHDVGMLACSDFSFQVQPTPKSEGWPIYAAHPDRAAAWLLAIAPDCTEAAQIICQHHQWVNGAGIAPVDKKQLHQGALMLGCSDLMFDRVMGLSGEDYQRGVLRTLFDVGAGFETRFDAALINAFETIAHGLTAPVE
ncbi:MAG: Hpt domain-containing protein [Formivibrio sp.]|nr:Hpt domain-containing protein [Formivibrio sp.]